MKTTPSASRPAQRSIRDDRGSVALLIIGLAIVILFLIAVVVDASAVFLHKQRLSGLADGAALRAADLGADVTYVAGVPQTYLQQSDTGARKAVRAYLDTLGQHDVVVVAGDGDTNPNTVTVELADEVALPLRLPGMGPTRIRATGTAAVRVQR